MKIKNPTKEPNNGNKNKKLYFIIMNIKIVINEPAKRPSIPSMKFIKFIMPTEDIKNIKIKLIFTTENSY